MNNSNPDPDLDFRFPSSPPPPSASTTQQNQDVVVSASASALASSSSSTYLETNASHRKKWKRSKMRRPDVVVVGGSSSSSPGPNPAKKPDPTAPKITAPCSECGRKFWSWKALHGHMRCHPERHWRGIQPPPTQRHVVQPLTTPMMTQDDHDAASSLLILADQGGGENDSRFECSSCKKVFGSQQALGGHRASHKNVKGCFAINNNPNTDDFAADQQQDNHPPHAYEEAADVAAAELEEAGHKCGICRRVFSSGQALGGHKRCHWERGEESLSSQLASYGVGLDLNLPASSVTTTSVEEDQHHHQLLASYSCSGLTVDLRLGL